MQFIYLFMYMTILLPLRGEKDTLFRIQLAQSIATVTDDPIEQLTLVKIARYESGFRRNVARCEVKGDKGKSNGTFQVQPITSSDAKKSCGNLIEQAEVALSYIRRSAKVCYNNIGAEKLNIYTSGRCEYGAKQAELRWGGNVEREFLIPNSGITEE